MPFIPVTQTTETARQAPPQTNASGEAFGAGIGRAVQGLGQTLGGIGGALAGAGEEKERQARTMRTAEFWANTDFAPQQIDAFNNAPLGGEGYTDGVLERYDTFTNEKIAEYNKLYPGDSKGADAIRLKMLEQRRSIAAGSWEDQQTMAVNNSKLDAQSGLDTSLNSIRTDPSEANFNTRLQAGIDLLNSRPGYNAVAKKDGIATFTSQAAASYFEGRLHAAESAADPLAAMESIRQELGTDTWEKRFLAPHYEALVKAVDSNITQAGGALRAIYKGQLADFKSRTEAYTTSMPESALLSQGEIARLGENIAKYGDASDRGDYAQMVWKQETYRSARGMSTADLKDARDTVANGALNITGATDYLRSRLTKGKPDYYITNMDSRLQTRLAAMFQAAEAAGFPGMSVFSGARTKEDQERIIRAGGGPRPTVGSATGSKHVQKMAADLGYNGGSFTSMPKAAAQWMHAHAGEFGLAFPLKDSLNEPWHVEIVEARGGAARGGGGGGAIPASVAPVIQRTASAYGHTPNLMGGIWYAESSGSLNPGTNPKSGARGPFQILPSTETYIEKLMGKEFDAENFEQAAEAASFYMKYLKERPWIAGDERLAIMAYNWGEGNVKNWLERGAPPDQVPTETQDYLAKVQGSGWEGAAGAPASGPGGPTMTDQQFTQYDELNRIINEQTTAINNDMIGFAFKNPPQMLGVPTLLGPTNITPDDFAARSQYAEQYAQYQNVAPKDIKPFSSEELTFMQTVMAGDDETQQLSLLAAINGMSPSMQDAAYRQLGEKDASFGIIGDRYRDAPDIALSALRGRKDRAAFPDREKAWETSPGAVLDAYNDLVGDAANGFLAKTQETMFDVAKSIYADMTRRTPTAELQPEVFEDAIAQAWGGTFEVVNGVKTFVPPDINPDKLMTWTSVARDVDWAAISTDKSFPVDIYNIPIEMDELAGAQFAALDNKGTYQISISDGKIYSPLTGDGYTVQLSSKVIDEGIQAAADDGVPLPTGTKVDPQTGAPLDEQVGIGVIGDDPAIPPPTETPAPVGAPAVPPVGGMGMSIGQDTPLQVLPTNETSQPPVYPAEVWGGRRNDPAAPVQTRSGRANKPTIVPPPPRPAWTPPPAATQAEIDKRAAEIAYEGYKIVLDGMDFDQATKDQLLKDYMDTYYPSMVP